MGIFSIIKINYQSQINYPLQLGGKQGVRIITLGNWYLDEMDALNNFIFRIKNKNIRSSGECVFICNQLVVTFLGT